MGFLEEVTAFEEKHTFRDLSIHGRIFHYCLCGQQNRPYTLVYLVGGTGNPLGWFKHVEAMEGTHSVLVLNYPLGIDQMEPMADLIGELIDALGIRKAVWIGASLGGYLAQLMASRFPHRTQAMVLYATTALTAQGIEDLKKQYHHVGKLLWLMEHLPYGLLKWAMKPSLNRMIPRDDPEQAGYLKEFVRWIYDSYERDMDLHMTRMMADMANVHPLTQENFAFLSGRILLILPEEDKAFTPEMQQGLISLMPGARLERSSGGHLDTLLKAEQFADLTKDFLSSLN